MKRKIVILLVTVGCLAVFGALLHSPPSFMDTVTGSTQRTQETTKEDAEMNGSYVFAIHTSAEGLEDETLREQLKGIVSGDTQTLSLKTGTTASSVRTAAVKFHIYVSDSDVALKKYAQVLCSKMKRAGVDVKIKGYPNTMLRSRILSGRYQAFFVSKDLLNVESLKQVDTVVLNSDKMTGTVSTRHETERYQITTF